MPNIESTPEKPSNNFEVALRSSRELPYGQVVRKEFQFGERVVEMQAYLRPGQAYVGERIPEDAAVVTRDNQALQAIVVDGGTQVEKVSTLDRRGLTGGKLIANEVERHGAEVSPAHSVEDTLSYINRKTGETIAKDHPTISYREDSRNTPYGSIAGIKIDTERNVLSAANAGDIYVVGIDHSDQPHLLSTDDVKEHDEAVFRVTSKLAKRYGLNFRQAMVERTKRDNLDPILQQMYQTMRKGNTGEIRRITGNNNFAVTHSEEVPLDSLDSVYVFSDGAALGSDLSTQEGLRSFAALVKKSGIEGLNEEILRRAEDDPTFEKYHRFGNIDDLLFLKFSVGKRVKQ